MTRSSNTFPTFGAFIRRISACAVLLVACAIFRSPSLQGQEKFGPGDAIVSIDGDPVLLGELNYLLTTNLRVKDLSAVPINVQQASSALLVKRHLAMKSLRQDGGEGLQRILDGEWGSFLNEIRGKGETLESFCRQKLSNEDSVRKSHDWDVAWRVYLKSKMTDANLRRFYQRDPEKYASAAWKVSHIFLPVDDDNADAKAIAEQRMERIVAELAGEADQASRLASRFKELAISESDGATAKARRCHRLGLQGWRPARKRHGRDPRDACGKHYQIRRKPARIAPRLGSRKVDSGNPFRPDHRPGAAAS